MFNVNVMGNFDSEIKRMTSEEINSLIKEGKRGVILFESFIGEYEIEGVKYQASSLSIGDDTLVIDKEDHLIVPTFFRRHLLSNQLTGDPNDLLNVDVKIDLKTNPISIRIYK